MIKMTAEKAKPKKKIPKIAELKKPLILGGFVAVIAMVGIVGGFYYIIINQPDGIEEKDTLVISVIYGPGSFDPLYWPWPAWENYYMFDQVAEGLFEIDNRNRTNPIQHNLAKSSEWSADALNLTCTLREGVQFHDGTSFNATAVKWHFDRIYNILENPEGWGNSSWWISILWYNQFFMPIINETIVLDDYIVRFVLNSPFIPFQTLLTHASAYILSPTSTPPDKILNVTYHTSIIGTGPFKLKSFFYDHNTTLVANPDYWSDDRPKVDEIIFEAFQGNDTIRQEGMLSGKYSFAYGDYEDEERQIFIDAPEIDVYELRTDAHWYIGMHNERINATMRKACSYAFNYSHYLEKIWEEPSVRCENYVPYGFLYSNWTAFNEPYYNIQIARQILKDAGWPGTETLTANDNITAGNEWEQLVTDGTPLATYNTSYLYDVWGPYTFNSWVVGNTSQLLAENLKQIGIKMEFFNLSRYEYYDIYVYNGLLDFFLIGYIPDFIDPFSVIYYQFINNFYAYNWQYINDAYVDQLLADSLVETDPIARKDLFYELQQYLIEESCPAIMLRVDLTYVYWNTSVGNVLSAYRNPYAFPMKDLYII